MEHNAVSIRPFIGAKDFDLSRRFYHDLGFTEIVLFDNMSLFTTDAIGFYLQDAYVKDWVDNTMVFVEVADVDDWGRECFLHDPSGILWHFGAFAKK